ncbi:oligomeric golgi family complex subunit 2 [Ophiostoma piceae UAMH 11346]|uniref:Conserved oligomeric Golgi complex subunit 2 n=1 Tax=Ophiostoma piceae (strain UAMH 11346) TaxID=1262450 RepID=S3BR36_OPHP1|nr:oligomeric golgi family complex subunit 2 [Ophiostoma piceae UAMH 11346]
MASAQQTGLGINLSAAGRPPASPYSAPPRSPYSDFHLPSESESGDDSNYNGDGEFGPEDLPFPTALSRKDFLAPTFDATAYLSSLFPSEEGGVSISAQRHQTLEDLRTELRERSSAISAELLELVNANYTSFLGLGDELKGGDEKVEDVRVALFGFRRSIEDVQSRVRERRIAMGDACRELGEVRSSANTGRRLLELDERVAQLEDRLAIAERSGGHENGDANHQGPSDPIDEAWDIESDDEDENEDENGEDAGDEDEFVASGPRKLATLARDLVLANQLADAVGHHIPLVKKADDRLAKCESTLLLDLSAAVKEARKVSGKASAPARAQTRLLKLLAIYRILDREDEVVRVLKVK